jgi:hypothetical protein
MATLPTQVRPGDIISSDLFNRLLAELAALDVRISTLETAANTPTLVRIFSLSGPTPIRVGSRVTANGEGFSRPGGANTIMVDGERVLSIAEGSSDAEHLVFDIVDPGLGGIARNVVLWVTNAEGHSGSFSFPLEPASTAPSGTTTLVYDEAPVGSGTSPNLNPGPYEFGFTLSAQVDGDVTIRLNASLGGVTGWTTELLRDDGTAIAGPVPVTRTLGTLRFKVRVNVPDTGAGAAILQVSAEETTPGTHVTPSSAPTLSLTRGSAIPQPETRVAVRLESTDSVAVSGGQVTFTRAVRGRLDFRFNFNLGSGFTGTTRFTWTATLDPATSANWTVLAPSSTAADVVNATGAGELMQRLTPGTGAGATRLLLNIQAEPSGQDPVDITYMVPLRVT